MPNNITIPIIKTTGLHFGSQSNFERFASSYFEKTDSNDSKFIDKSIIHSIKYDPDSTYCHTDGYCGTCWVAEMIDSSETDCFMYYHFRNFVDLVEFYREKGYKFVEN